MFSSPGYIIPTEIVRHFLEDYRRPGCQGIVKNGASETISNSVVYIGFALGFLIAMDVEPDYAVSRLDQHPGQLHNSVFKVILYVPGHDPALL